MRILLIAALMAGTSLGAAPIVCPLPAGTKTIEVGASATVKTLEDALDEVAKIRTTDKTTLLALRLAPGDYAPTRPLEITGRHASKNFAPLIVTAADFEKKPRIHGGLPVTGWSKTTFHGRTDVWVADVSALKASARPRLLFFNGKRLQPARWPNLDAKRPYTTGYAFADARGMKQGDRFGGTGLWTDEIQIRPTDVRPWAHPEDGWTIVYSRHNWWNNLYDIRAVSNGVVLVKTARREITDNLFPWDRWCVENIAEELDQPGEWYYDARAKKVYLISPDGSSPADAVVTLTKQGPILQIADSSNCTIAGLELTGGEAGIWIKRATHVQVLGCSLHDIGSHGEGSYEKGSGIFVLGLHVRIADCDIHNIGSHGIFVHGYEKNRRVDDRMEVDIENNYLHHCGEINSHGIGIWNSGQGVRVRHNLIHDMPRCALLGYGRFCEISYNRVRHVNTINDDTGALYDGGWCSGTGSRVCYNWISDSIGFQRQGNGTYRLHQGACGIYPDEGMGGLAVYGNLIEHCHHAAMHLHNGRWITISNNVFVSNSSVPVNGGTFQLSMQTWDSQTNGYFMAQRRADISAGYRGLIAHDPKWLTFPELAQAPDKDVVFSNDGTTMMGVQVKNNIFAYPDQGAGMMLRAWDVNWTTNFFNKNVYWPGQTTNIVVHTVRNAKDSWASWRAKGQDTASVIADPLFRDAAKGDYRLKPNSPAFKLGFVDLPYDKMGLKKSHYRPTLPKEAEGVREHPEWLRE